MSLVRCLDFGVIYLQRPSVGCRQRCSVGECMHRRRVICASSLDVADAQGAVDAGLVELEKKGNPERALEYFNRALELNPNEKEAGAAAYNIACCYIKTNEWDKAAEQVITAVTKYRVDIAIPKNDADLAEFRKRPEWDDVLGAVPGAMSKEVRYNMISEARSPFRLFRFWAFGGISTGAGIGLIIITSNLINAISNGSPLQQPLQNLGINAAALLVFGYLFLRDFQARDKDKKVIEREELLSSLLIEKAPGKVLSLAELRGTVRPIIIVGNKMHCQKTKKSAEPYKPALKERGVALVPVELSAVDKNLASLKKDFQSQSSTVGFGEEIDTSKVRKGDRWELKIAEINQWKEWIKDQKDFSGLTDNSLFFQVQLDGSVRTSGSGMPPWDSIVADLPPMDDIRTKLTDNIGF